MKKSLKIMFLLVLMSISVFGQKIKNGEDLIAAMQKKYQSKWYQTLTFKQVTNNYKEDGSFQSEVWYEALSLPGKLRIDFAPIEKGNGMLFVDGKLFSFRDGKLLRTQPLTHPLLILGFDVYLQPVEKTVAQLKSLKIDLSSIREDKWNGRKVYVVGTKTVDEKVPQFWVDKKDLYFVRLLEPKGKDKNRLSETQFNKYLKVKGGGWLST